jgi:opacity protein-like surface antigen
VPLKRLFAVAFVLSAFAAPAAAQLSWYAGAAAGQSRTDSELVANRESTLVFARDVRTDFDARDNAWKGFAGARFGRHVALELSYADLGSSRMNTTLLGGDPALPAAIAIDRKITGVGLDLVGLWPLAADRLDLFAKVGTFRARLEASASLEGNIEFSGGSGERSRSTSRTESVAHYGLGLQYWMTPGVAIRAEWERYRSIGKPFEVGGSGTTGRADTDAAWVGVVARF